MDARVRFLDSEGIDCQVVYPTLGLLWEGGVEDPPLADALCRACNTWAFELCAAHKDRLFPAAHISLRDPGLAVAELERAAKLGWRTIFAAAAPAGGRSFGHPDFDPIWADVQDLDLSVGIHLVGHPHYTGSEWYRGQDPGFMFVTMNVIQDPRMALTTMVYDTGHTSQMKRSANGYFARNIRVNGDPEEKMFPLMVRFAGDSRFFVGSDYPHAEGFTRPIHKARELLSGLPALTVGKILGQNAQQFFGL